MHAVAIGRGDLAEVLHHKLISEVLLG